MLEVLILSVLGLAGTSVGALWGSSADEDGTAAGAKEAGGSSEDTDGAEGSILVEVSSHDANSKATEAPPENDMSSEATGRADTITGSEGADQIAGLGGDDTLSGEGGDDSLEGGRGSDEISGDDGDDTLMGGTGSDVLTDWAGSNKLMGEGGNDTLRGGFDDSAISSMDGGKGQDALMDGDADATLWGGKGDDQIISGHGTGEIYGGGGADHIETGIDTDTIFGGRGADNIVAIGTDTEGEVDRVYGGAGDDMIFARGATEVSGDGGKDTFAGYHNAWVKDAAVIADYNPSEDTLQVHIDSHEWRSTLEDFTVEVSGLKDGSGAAISVDGIEVMHVLGAAGLELDDVEVILVGPS